MKFKNWFFVLMALCAIAVIAKSASAYYASVPKNKSTSNLQAYSNNLDILSDKEGSLHQLFNELYGIRVWISSGAPVNTNIFVPGLSSTGSIVSVEASSAACVTLASSRTITEMLNNSQGSNGELEFRSRLMGTAGNNITIAITQISSQPVYGLFFSSDSFSGVLSTNAPNGFPGTLQVNTTGYSVEIKLSTGYAANFYSSGTMVCAAVRANVAATALVTCDAVNLTTATIVSLAQTSLNGGLGTQAFGQMIIPTSYVVDPSSRSDYVQLSTGAPVSRSDSLKWIYRLNP